MMEVVKAFVALKPGYEPSRKIEMEIMNYIRKRLSPLAMPQEIEFVDKLPKTRAARSCAACCARRSAARRSAIHRTLEKTSSVQRCWPKHGGAYKTAAHAPQSTDSDEEADNG